MPGVLVTWDTKHLHCVIEATVMRRGIQEPTQARFACMEGLKQVLVDCVRLTPTTLEKVKVRYKYLKD